MDSTAVIDTTKTFIQSLGEAAQVITVQPDPWASIAVAILAIIGAVTVLRAIF